MEVGHTITSTPPCHCVFNPIETIWRTLKRNFLKNNTNPNFLEGTTEMIAAKTL